VAGVWDWDLNINFVEFSADLSSRIKSSQILFRLLCMGVIEILSFLSFGKLERSTFLLWLIILQHFRVVWAAKNVHVSFIPFHFLPPQLSIIDFPSQNLSFLIMNLIYIVLLQLRLVISAT
jgi:hypothetical protein